MQELARRRPWVVHFRSRGPRYPDWVIDRVIEERAGARGATGRPRHSFSSSASRVPTARWVVDAPFDSLFPTLDERPHEKSNRTRLGYADPELLGTREFGIYRSHSFSLDDGSLRFMDSEIARLVEYLRQQKLYADSVIAIAADHGQAFWDHAAEEKVQSQLKALGYVE